MFDAIVHSTKDPNKVGCLINMQGNYFDLSPLSLPVYVIKKCQILFSLGNRSQSRKYEVIYNDSKGLNNVQFNICNVNARMCADGQEDYANQITANNTCNHLSVLTEEGPGG